MLADAQYRLYQKHCQEQGIPDENIHFRDCYRYGPSTLNIRVENWWLRLVTQQTWPWIQLFRYFEKEGFYCSDLTADRVVLLFIFMPIIRSELRDYVTTWNAHRIRPQRHRPNHVPGIPNQLYQNGQVRGGFTPNPALTQSMSDELRGHGTYVLRQSN